MRITIIGSIALAKEMVELYRKLEGMGHNPQMIEYTMTLALKNAAAAAMVADYA